MSAYSATVFGDIEAPPNTSKSPTHPKPLPKPLKTTSTPLLNLENDYLDVDRPFFVRIDESKGGLLGALKELDNQLRAVKRNSILSRKKPTSWIGRTVEAGAVGLYDHGGLPKLVLTPGRYPGFPLANWFARSWSHVAPLSSSVLQFRGLTIVQVSQNQAAVVSDPANQVFVIKNGGFVSLSIEGSYKVLGVVDQVNLSTLIVDPLAGGKETRVLGHKEEVKLKSEGREYVVASFLDIPANNCVILQKGDDLEQLPAGQHCITTPGITVRGWFSKGEAQLEMPSRDMFTKDQVPVELRVYLRWQLLDPLKLCSQYVFPAPRFLHVPIMWYSGYNTPYEALKDKTLSVLTQIVSHLEYASLVRQRQFSPGDDAQDGPDSASSAFLDALRTQAMDELHEAALEYGIELRDLAVIDRKFKGEIAKQMDALVTRALQAQVEAANVERENSNRVKKEEGSLQVAQVQAQQRKTEADAAAYTLIASAKAKAEAVKIAAQAEAEAIKIQAQAEASAISLRGEADGRVVDGHARIAQLARVDVQRIAAYGSKTVFVPTGGEGAGNGFVNGYGLALGASQAQAMKPVQSQA